jgi:glycosyltransferase involved in cell wall biosynthesis
VIVCIQDSNTWIDEVLASVGTDPRLEILRMPMTYLGGVRNRGIQLVKTEWVAFCDGDDVWCKGKTLAQREYAEKHKCDFVGCDHYLTDEAGHIRAFALAKYLPMPSSWLVRTKVMVEHPFKEEKKLNGIEDSEWWKRTARENAFPKGRCPKLLLRYRVRGVSLSTTEPSKIRKAKAVKLASIPVIGWGVWFLTGCMWLVNRSESYRPLLK